MKKKKPFFDYSATCNNKQSVTEPLDKLPSDCVFTPVEGKAAYLPGWQNPENAPSRKQIQKCLTEGHYPYGRGKAFKRPTGIGLVTGGKYIAIDRDGENGCRIEQAIAQNANETIPPTVTWTSGKPDRSQSLFRLSDKQSIALSELPDFTRIEIHSYENIPEVKDGDGKIEQLEIRGAKCQSVLPPSYHPETGSYKWIISPSEIEVAVLPNCFFQIILNKLVGDRANKEKAEKESAKRKAEWEARKAHLGTDWNEEELAISALGYLDPNMSRHDWIKVLSSLKTMGLRAEAESWSQGSSKYNAKGFERDWNSLEPRSPGMLFNLAKKEGFEFPHPQKKEERHKYFDYIKWLEDWSRYEEDIEKDRIYEAIDGYVLNESIVPQEKPVSRVKDVDVWFPPGERLKTYSRIRQEHPDTKYTLDLSATGTWNSHSALQLCSIK